ncbi:low molecular weight phosphotyrosine protein phosphatase [Kineosporia sp. J2-2]|uniref:protein-tyrosine-phosphatase n=1 Tax=Kineosporia corallincola TaxID=2835133 RepID=A0ABS5THT3_9ACTN|nr:low molecular weight protein-tyrosine-phosphatase [Kineosporia corallincola]MBT0770655.1 low molecular weight phosphotyrosine protein phosphatase [Kineosporia corallincola]
MSAYRICFVCTGNICRSPSAEVIVRARAQDAGLDVDVDSAGTDSYHVGDGADERAVQALKNAGYDGTRHVARQFDEDWFAGRDLIVAMDRGHARILHALAPDEESAAKIRLLRSFDPDLEDLDHDDRRLDVPDPYYDRSAENHEFTEMIEQIEAAADGLVDFLAERTEHPA